MSSLVASALCMKAKSLLTPRQILALDLLKAAVPGFRQMRLLALRFQAILRGHRAAKLDRWVESAKLSGMPALQGFAKTLCRDLEAVKNAIRDRWSNGQVEGQITRLKMLKRAMYGRASVQLIQCRMLSLS